MASATLQLVVQPPAVAQSGVILEPPIALTMSTTSMANGQGGNLGSVWASAALITEGGTVMSDSLSGSLNDSVQSFANQDDSVGYFLFDDLVIDSIGNFRIRVNLMGMENGSYVATVLDQVETDVIIVEEDDVELQAPSSSEQRFLDALPNQC